MRWLESKFSKQTTKTYLLWLYRILGCLSINSPLYGCVYRDVCEEQTIDSQTQNFRCSDAWATFYREGEVDDVICQRYVLAAYSCTMLFEPKSVDVHVCRRRLEWIQFWPTHNRFVEYEIYTTPEVSIWLLKNILQDSPFTNITASS